MFNFKFLFFILCLLLILSVSVVNASETVDDGMRFINDSHVESSLESVDNDDFKRDEILASSGDDVIGSTLTSNASSFSGLQSEIDDSSGGDVIVLSKNIIQDADSHMNISVDGLIIDGNGHIINANSKSRIFNITGNDVVLKNIVFINGKVVDESGGAIYWGGNNGKLINCNFTSNIATSTTNVGTHGGAIYWKGSNVNLSGCNFNNNYVQGSSCSGGAIYFSKIVRNLIFDSNFTNNRALWYSSSHTGSAGGAIYFAERVYDVSFVGRFESNFLQRSGGRHNSNDELYGGAIYFANIVNNIYLEADFISNRAGYSGHRLAGFGGAIYFANSMSGKIGGKFISNSAQSSSLTDGNYGAYGGAIYFSNKCVCNITAIFENNYVKASNSGRGGVIYLHGSNSVINGGKFIGSNSVISIDAGNTQGGVFYVQGSNNAIINSSFIDNFATSGGALYVIGSSNRISNSSFRRNNAVNGACIYASDSLVLVDNYFINNSAIGYGGVIYTTGDLNINCCRFINCSASCGGAVCSNDLILSGSNFINNSATMGSDLFIVGGLIDLINVALDSDYPCVYFKGDSYFHCFNVTFNKISNILYVDGECKVYLTNIINSTLLGHNNEISSKLNKFLFILPTHQKSKFKNVHYYIGNINRIFMII